ncbi:MAG TPA: glycosyltransferase family 1 protein [Opitutaceae bacterium]|nr:glycosyltransferase family 1 protein [Opitutaceae bacterium]
MKIALVTETFPPEINGVAMTLGQLASGLVERGHRVTVFRPRQSISDSPALAAGYAELLVRGFPIPGYALLKLGLPSPRTLQREWRRERPDLVHIATEGPLGYSALVVARKLQIPITSSFHTNFHSYSKHYGFPFAGPSALAYLRHFHNRTLATFSPTLELNAQLEENGFKNMRLLGRGVDTDTFSPARRNDSIRKQLGLTPKDLLVVHVSRLAAEKNYSLLIESFRAIKRIRPTARLVVTSDGPLRKRLARENLDVVFTGFLSRLELAEHYASADLFLYPSLTETFGNVVTEALASGLPVVAFNYAAAARYIRHQENGWLVPLADSRDFVESAVLLASNDALRAKIIPRARATAEGIPWSAVIDGFARDLSDLVGAQAQVPTVSATV